MELEVVQCSWFAFVLALDGVLYGSTTLVVLDEHGVKGVPEDHDRGVQNF